MPHPRTATSFSSLLVLVLSASSAFAQAGTWVDRGVPQPFACSGSLVGFDRARGETVWFGGSGCQETWVWNGAGWQQRAIASPQPPYACVGVYDSVRQVVVAVSGNHSTGLQTWEWDGASWQQAGGGPSPRSAFGMAFDAARGVTVLFGGNQGNTTASVAETWTWDGVTWTLAMVGGPVPRSSPGMTFDSQLQTVLLFGGEGQQFGQPIFFGDTWEWNGSQWLAHFPVVGPTPRRAPGVLAYDRLRDRTVLQGGSDGNGLLSDTWEWNGSAWTQVQPLGVPVGASIGMVHDDLRGVMVLPTIPNTTWEYVPGNAVAATFATFGSGCPGPAGVPTLTNQAGSLPRIGSTLHLHLANLPASLSNLPIGFLGFDATSWGGIPLPLSLTPFGFPGCEALLAPARTDGLVNVAGSADWAIALPMNALALGFEFYVQGAVLAPGWSVGGLVFSNAGHAVVGSP